MVTELLICYNGLQGTHILKKSLSVRQSWIATFKLYKISYLLSKSSPLYYICVKVTTFFSLFLPAVSGRVSGMLTPLFCRAYSSSHFCLVLLP